MHTLGASSSVAVIYLSSLPDVPTEISLKMFIAALFTVGKKRKTRDNFNAYEEEKNNGLSS